MSEPATFAKVNARKRWSRVPGLSETSTPREQFWAERLRALKRYLEGTYASNAESAPAAAPMRNDGG